jgi:hypothetical protein
MSREFRTSLIFVAVVMIVVCVGLMLVRAHL